MAPTRTALLSLVLAGVLGCTKPLGWYVPQPTPSRPETIVNADFERTWNAVIDHFAANVIPIATIDRASGLIVAKTAAPGAVAARGADCGAYRTTATTTEGSPTAANYNILVRTTPSGTRVRATIAWEGGLTTDRGFYPCQSTGVVEAEMETAIKALAERPRE